MSVNDIAGIYRHSKTGKLYEVFDVALHTETSEKMVLYKALYRSPDLEAEYGADPYFVRPFNIFFENVMVNGTVAPRFVKVESDGTNVQ